MSRAEFAKMSVRALNLENSFAEESFRDVNAGQWFTPYVAAAASKGIITGRSADVFAPQDKITRAEMATMISRALKHVHQLRSDKASNESVLSSFSDQSEDVKASYRQGAAFAVDYDLIIGSGGKFNPAGITSRAEPRYHLPCIELQACNQITNLQRLLLLLHAGGGVHFPNI